MLERDKNLQLTQIQKVEEKVKVTEDEVKQQERVAYSLENELAQFKAETVKQRTTIYTLEKEREKYGVEASEQRTMYLQAMEEVKMREIRINELQKKISEWEAKLKQQQQLY